MSTKEQKKLLKDLPEEAGTVLSKSEEKKALLARIKAGELDANGEPFAPPLEVKEAQVAEAKVSTVIPQKGVLYTDGLSGGADSNLERAYEIPENLQSNDPEVRAVGDESLSEAAKNDKTSDENERADFVKTRDDEVNQSQ